MSKLSLSNDFLHDLANLNARLSSLYELAQAGDLSPSEVLKYLAEIEVQSKELRKKLGPQSS